MLQEDSEVYPTIFKTYSEITKPEKNTFNDYIARIWEDNDGDDVFQSYYDKEIDIINNIKPILQKMLDIENNMIRENYFYENINELEFDKNGQYKWGKFNNILNENKKNIEKSLKIDGILLNSPEGIKESRYKEELFTRLTEINQTTDLKNIYTFFVKLVRLFIREKDRLQNIVTSSSSDSESDSSSETEEVTDNNLSGKDFKS